MQPGKIKAKAGDDLPSDLQAERFCTEPIVLPNTKSEELALTKVRDYITFWNGVEKAKNLSDWVPKTYTSKVDGEHA